MRAALPVPPQNYIAIGKRPGDYRGYEDLIAAAKDTRPDVTVDGNDPWTLMYTSGTTGKPKGAVRNHKGGALLSLVTEVELGLSRHDAALLVMPMCHANSLYFFGAFSYCGAACTVYNRKSFDPEHLIRTLAEGGATFTSLVPTHYIMMLGLPAQVRARYNVDAVTKLMISSAPARRDTKARHHGLLQEHGAVRTLRLDRSRLGHHAASRGAIHQARLGRARMRRLAADPPARRGRQRRGGRRRRRALFLQRLHVRRLLEAAGQDQEAFRGDYCTVGDLARRDEDGYIFLVDRQSNMIISGGENIYPSEVEAMLGGHPKVKDVAVIGVADEKWGERVHAVIVPRDGEAPTEAESARLVPEPHRRVQTPARRHLPPRGRHAAHRHRKSLAPRPERPA